MNHYEEKQQAKKERFQQLAERAENKSTILAERSSRMMEAIPFGQPILIGHHSEKRDRSYRNRAWNTMGKSVEESKKTDYYSAKAERIGNGGISSDDPEAVVKLKIKLQQLEDSQKSMKKQNAKAKAHKLPKPFERFMLTNNNARIRNVKQRIEELKKAQSFEVKKDIIGDGWVLTENKEQNRIMFIFEEKPEEEIRKILKSHGFRWSPMNKAWQRMLNANGRYAAKYIINLITKNAINK